MGDHLKSMDMIREPPNGKILYLKVFYLDYSQSISLAKIDKIIMQNIHKMLDIKM